MANSTAQTVLGSDLMLFVGGKSVGFATNHSLTINSEMLDNASKDHASGLWKGTTIKSLSWQATTENLFAYDAEGKTFQDLYNLMITRQAVDLILAIKLPGTAVENTIGLSVTEGGWSPDTTVGSIRYQGKAFISSVNINAPNGDNATFSVNFEGTGELSVVTVTQ